MKRILLVVMPLLLVVIGMGFLSYNGKGKIAYVRSQDLVYSYAGTLEAMDKFNKEKEAWQANVDTLELNFNKAVNNYNENYSQMTESDRIDQSNNLDNQQRQLLGYKNAIDEKIKSKDDEMMQAVLNQVNTFIKEYGKENGYDVILGTTLSGSVLYGRQEIDITDQLLEALNKNYKGE
ncbi:MAG: OmpH family outer membrane protein [Bacteroidota bacterium]